jgi:hypothetical protein
MFTRNESGVVHTWTWSEAFCASLTDMMGRLEGCRLSALNYMESLVLRLFVCSKRF